MTGEAGAPLPRFSPGTRVKVLHNEPEAHCRTPSYLRGAVGEIDAVVGLYRNPSLLAFHRPGLPKRALYRVKFRQKDIWPEYAGARDDTLYADLYEHWLESLNGGANARE